MSAEHEIAIKTLSDLMSVGGAGAVVVDLDNGSGTPGGPASGIVHIGVKRDATLPNIDLDSFDILLCTDLSAPIPWVGIEAERLDSAIEGLCGCVDRQLTAAAVAVQVLRIGERLPFEQALALESFAYSTLLSSSGFKAWRAMEPVRERPDDGAPRVLSDFDGKCLQIVLNRPSSRNAFDALMRDAMTEALEFALHRDDIEMIELSGEGDAFSAGGDLNEFGQASDVGIAHLIRLLRSPVRLVNQLRSRTTARLHGACIGAGIEIPAAAGRVTARSGTFFHLPEVGMGLIPGAGGTASIPRRIGRHRTCYLALSSAVIGLQTAVAWGLVDAVENPS